MPRPLCCRSRRGAYGVLRHAEASATLESLDALLTSGGVPGCSPDAWDSPGLAQSPSASRGCAQPGAPCGSTELTPGYGVAHRRPLAGRQRIKEVFLAAATARSAEFWHL